jgi:hypothetical protein
MELHRHNDDYSYIDEIRTSAAQDISHLADHSQGGCTQHLRSIAPSPPPPPCL